MQYIQTLDELDIVLEDAARLAQHSDTDFRNRLDGLCLQLDTSHPDFADPASPPYRAAQLKLYERIAGKPYATANEESIFDVEHALKWPFPYVTRNGSLVGNYLMSYGFVIKLLNLPPGASILEVGSGFGPLTMHLASMGYAMTCLDISSTLLNYVQTRAQALPTPVQTICGDMTTVDIPGQFDAVVFYESFHHCLDHAAMLARIPALLKKNGLLLFAAEPIVPVGSGIVPYPWGLRLDGLSLWSIRRWGWLELGFQDTYFRQLLLHQGWQVQRHNLLNSALTDVWLASRDGFAGLELPKENPSETLAAVQHDLARLRALVQGYERGRFMRLMRWLRGNR